MFQELPLLHYQFDIWKEAIQQTIHESVKDWGEGVWMCSCPSSSSSILGTMYLWSVHLNVLTSGVLIITALSLCLQTSTGLHNAAYQRLWWNALTKPYSYRIFIFTHERPAQITWIMIIYEAWTCMSGRVAIYLYSVDPELIYHWILLPILYHSIPMRSTLPA